MKHLDELKAYIKTYLNDYFDKIKKEEGSLDNISISFSDLLADGLKKIIKFIPC